MKRWRLILVTVLVLAALSAGIVYSLRPRVMPELVGKWQGRMYTKSVYEFRADGTYSSRGVEILSAGGPEETFTSTGEWRATKTSIQFKALSGDSVEGNKKVPLKPTHQWASMPIKWNADGTWQPTEVGIGTFHKIP